MSTAAVKRLIHSSSHPALLVAVFPLLVGIEIEGGPVSWRMSGYLMMNKHGVLNIEN